MLCGRKNFSLCRARGYDGIVTSFITLCYTGLHLFRLERDSPPGFKKCNLLCVKGPHGWNQRGLQELRATPGQQPTKNMRACFITTRNRRLPTIWMHLEEDPGLQMKSLLIDTLISVLWHPEQRTHAQTCDLQKLCDNKNGCHFKSLRLY